MRAACHWLRARAEIGPQLRLLLAEAGSAVWTPSEDLLWRTWTCRYGDKLARSLLLEFDAQHERWAAEFKAAGELSEGSLGANAEALPRTARTEEVPGSPFWFGVLPRCAGCAREKPC